MDGLFLDKILLSTASEVLSNEELGEAMRLIITDGDLATASDKGVTFFVALVKKSQEEKEEKRKRISEINSVNGRKRSQAVADKKSVRLQVQQKEEQEKEKDNGKEEKESNIKNKEEKETDKKNKEQEDAASNFREKNLDEKADNIVSPINSVSTQKIELTQEEKEKNKKIKEEIKEIGEFWNAELMRLNSSLPKIVGIGVQRSSAITAMIKENGIEKVKETITEAVSSEFLNSGAFICGFDWCMKPTNFLKISEGNYKKNKNNAKNKNAFGEVRESASERIDRLFHLGKYAQDGDGKNDVIDLQGCFGEPRRDNEIRKDDTGSVSVNIPKIE